jgi:hypothetical protein
MIVLVQAVVATVCIWVFVQRFWRRGETARARAHALTAVLLSSGSAAAWAVLVAPHLPSYSSALFAAPGQSRTLDALIGTTVLFTLFSLGPNLVGMAILSAALTRHPSWLRLCQSGAFVPVGAAYGLGVLAASVLPLALPAAVTGGLAPLLSVVGASFFYAPAILSGITAVGTYTLLERSSGTTALPSAP